MHLSFIRHYSLRMPCLICHLLGYIGFNGGIWQQKPEIIRLRAPQKRNCAVLFTCLISLCYLYRMAIRGGLLASSSFIRTIAEMTKR